MKLPSLVFLFFFIALSAPKNAHSDEPVQLACTNFPPFKIQSNIENQPHSGIDLDVVSAAMAVTERTAQFAFYPWKRTVSMVEKGTADALCGCDYRPEREEKFIFSDMLGLHSQGIFVNANSSIRNVDTLDQLKGKTIATVRGYALEKALENYPTIKLMRANDDAQLLKLLLNGRVDAIYAYRDVIYYQQTLINQTSNIHYFELSSKPYYLCFSRTAKNIDQTIRAFNRGLRHIRHDGTYSAIRQKYRKDTGS